MTGTRITVTGTPGEVRDLIATARASGRLAHINGPTPTGHLLRVDVWLTPTDRHTQPPTSPTQTPEVVEVTYHLHRGQILHAAAGLASLTLAGLVGYLLAGATGAITAVLVLLALATIIGVVRDWDTHPAGKPRTPVGS